MEYAIMAGAVCAFAALIFLLEWRRAASAEKQFVRRLREDCTFLADKEYRLERFARMGSYYERHLKSGQVDDITWNDLGMDELFKRMNYTLSASGEEYLYYTLRTPKQSREEIDRLEELLCFLGQNPETRVQLQLKFRKLGYTGKYSLYDYLDHLDGLGERSNFRNILCDLLFIPFIVLLWFQFSAGILGIVGLTIYNILTYFKQKGEIDPYITSFAYVIRLLEVCGGIEKLAVPVCAEEWEKLHEHRQRLQGVRSHASWVMSPTRGNASAGDVLSVLMDYIRMVFHADLIQFNRMLRCLRGHREDIDALIGIVGYLETAVAVQTFRKSLHNGYCLPQFGQTGSLEAEQLYHPLLEKPVKNSICAERGVLLTGSNASGKSTFLKTVAVNAILAQSVNTCAADSYHTSFRHVYSSMALRDNIAGGESYYIVEIKALKRIMDAAQRGEPVLCFVDEVLRGTNTVERIAASTQILKYLGSTGILCFAATHDIELTQLLDESFDNYHFEETVLNDDVVFPYRLMRGRASTRNAIRLLELMGYDPEVTKQASALAERFLETGSWTPA